jgi:hypothetical protein
VQFHFLLLDRIADQDRTPGKTRFPGGVLWMEMCRCKKEFLVGRGKLGRNARDGRAVGRPKARIDN